MIEVKGLAKRFALENPKAGSESGHRDPRQRGRFFHSVEQVSLSCKPGEVLGLIGPNGAGKTTTLRMLSGVLQPDRGEVVIDGEELHRDDGSVRRKVGFLSATTAIYERLTVEENLRYFGQLYGLTPSLCDERIEALCSQLDMDDFRHRRVLDLSSGMKQRANIARAVVHQPKVIIFDEPTTGLDIMSTETILQFIDSQKQAGRPVIFSTHHLEEVSLLCDQLSVILVGRSNYNGPLEAFAGSRDAVALRRTFMQQHERSMTVAGSMEAADVQADLA
ncbi:ATP-binding cassette domain-containing protein [Ferrimonas pelagia]|uniref:ATP-binding cassette domain-containing protein n=1 Tax=Ferrimonas pelagia TaxID=1177826 RepID=A0ABP9EDC5_9GAMM